MVLLTKWQRRQWMQEYKQRVAWQKKHPGKLYRSNVIGGPITHSYVCFLCEKRFFYFCEDEESPQYKRLKGTGQTLCHECWHTFRSNTACRICQLRKAEKEARRAVKVRSKLGQSNNTEQKKTREVGWIAATGEPVRVRRSVGLSSRRSRDKDKKNRGSRRRRSSRVS